MLIPRYGMYFVTNVKQNTITQDAVVHKVEVLTAALQQKASISI